MEDRIKALGAENAFLRMENEALKAGNREKTEEIRRFEVENAELRSTDTYFKLHALNNIAEAARSRVVELEAQLVEARATNTRLNRRATRAEGAALVTIEDCRREGVSFGRMLANNGIGAVLVERDKLQAENAELRDDNATLMGDLQTALSVMGVCRAAIIRIETENAELRAILEHVEAIIDECGLVAGSTDEVWVQSEGTPLEWKARAIVESWTDHDVEDGDIEEKDREIAELRASLAEFRRVFVLSGIANWASDDDGWDPQTHGYLTPGGYFNDDDCDEDETTVFEGKEVKAVLRDGASALSEWVLYAGQRHEYDQDCSSCGEECCEKGECPHSKRSCGHHCNCSWTQDECCWCGKKFGEDEADQKDEKDCEIAELRATLAAEQGKQEGAVSEKWHFSIPADQWETDDGWAIARITDTDWYGWILSRDGYDGEEEFETARAAMQHADKVDGEK